MKHLKYLLLFLATTLMHAQNQAKADSAYVRDHYTKLEQLIPMRDGTKLFTAIYQPKDTSQKYPILLNRTPYAVAPYGAQQYKQSLGNFPAQMREGYIFVYQDVRGRWMSEGNFEDVRPQLKKQDKKRFDESTDTYDTIEWLIKKVANNNGKVGMYGISYPGFYATAALINAHPALKAVSPQAPVTDWFVGDDFHHNGVLFLQDAFGFMSGFGVNRPLPVTPDKAPKRIDFPLKDAYTFYLNAGSPKNLKDKYFGDKIKFWNDLFAHPTYDAFWKDRKAVDHVKNVKPAVMVVGGLFDAEDVYGAFETYRTIEKNNPKNNNILVAGPWFHGGWVRSDGSKFGDISFGTTTSLDYQAQFELPFFNYHLKGKGAFQPKEANVFVTGSNRWNGFNQWPPKEMTQKKLYLQPQNKLSFEPVGRTDSWDEYVSDPNKPVPFQDGNFQNRNREYMIADQRFAAKRPDVVLYETPVLTEDMTLTGVIEAHLSVSTTGTDADYVVKIIDVYPEDAPTENNVIMSGYQMLVRAEIFRGSFRNGLDHPQQMDPGFVTRIDFNLPDVAHTFLKGHKLMIQIQNTWFPLAERNPQQFLDRAATDAKDYIKATHRIFHDVNNPSYLTLPILK